MTFFLTSQLTADSNLGVFAQIEAKCDSPQENRVDCQVEVLVNYLSHPDYFEEVTHLIIVENQDCSKAVFNDILYFTNVESEGQSFEIVKTYSRDVKTWFSACLFMEEELIESLPVSVEGHIN